MLGKKIMVAEDDVCLQKFLNYFLIRQGFNVMVVGQGPEVITECLHFQPDLLLLDIMMPGMDGFEICRKIREESSLPIIILSARDGNTDKILGLTLGCDDYITKPFENTELLLRIKAVLRRVKEQRHQENEQNVVKLPGLTISRITRVTEVGGRLT